MSEIVCFGVINRAIQEMYGVVGQGTHKFEVLKLDTATGICTISLAAGSASQVRAALTLLGEYDGHSIRVTSLNS